MIVRRFSDNRLQLSYDGKIVNAPYVYGITISNTGAYAVTNEDFKDLFSIDFLGSEKLVYAQVVKASNGAITEEVLSNAKIDGTMLTITDFYLNKEESFGIYLIVDSKPDTINYHSRISGISKLTLRNTPKEKHNNRIKIGILVLAIVAVVFVIFIVVEIVWSRKWKKREKEFLQKYIETQQENKKQKKCVCQLSKSLDFMQVFGSAIMNTCTTRNPRSNSISRIFLYFPADIYSKSNWF